MPERFESWKEIAAYLGRGVRTVQRWEKTESLPVHRHMHDRQGSVYAFRAELDAWRASRAPGFEAGERTEPDVPAAPDPPSTRVAGRPSAWWLAPAVIVVCAAFVIAARRTEPTQAPAPRVSHLTTFPGWEHAPAFSPDGRLVAFSHRPATESQSDIYIKTIGGGEPVRFTNAPKFEFNPAWSPDGRMLAFLRTSDKESWDVVVRPLDGQVETKVASVQFGAYPAPLLRWSHDPRYLLMAERPAPDAPGAIYRLAVASGEKRAITFPPAGSGGDGAVALSPDGRQLAFTRSAVSAVDRHVFVVDLTDEVLPQGPPRQLTSDVALVSWVTWLPRGRVLFAALSNFESTWHEVAASGGPVTVREDFGTVRPAAVFSADGTRAVYSLFTEDHNIWRIDLETGEQRALVHSTRIDTNPQISPDGRFLAFASDRSGAMEIWRTDADGGNAVQLTRFGRSAGTPRWAPDGSHIAFDLTDESGSDVWVMTGYGAQQRQLTRDPAREFVPSWSHDGKWIYFGSLKTGLPQVWKVSPGGGTATQVTKNGGYGGGQASPDGKWLYVPKQPVKKDDPSTGIYRVDLATGLDELVIPVSINWSRMALGEGGVYFVERVADDKFTVNFFEFATRTPRVVATLARPGALGFSVAPGEKWLVYGAVENSGSDLMLNEGLRP